MLRRLTGNWRAIELDDSGYKLSVGRQCNGYETHDSLHYFDGQAWRDTGAELILELGISIRWSRPHSRPMDSKSLSACLATIAMSIDNGLIEVYELQ